MTITIYTIMDADHYRLGTPATHTLDEPEGISRTWVTRAEYALPEGYTASESNGGAMEVYNANGQQCPITDSRWMGKGGGSPILVDNEATPWRVKLQKVRDLPW